MRCALPALLFLPLSFIACSVEDVDTLGQEPEGAGGKADEIGGGVCPAAVRLNSASGTAKRCIDDDTGRFVSTACCADICEGAGWREQSNGPACAWLAEPGMEGAKKGQFAPVMCCDLNDTMACGRGETAAAGCVDSDDPGRAVDDACCEEQPTECVPLVKSELRDCVSELRFDMLDDPEARFPNPLEALEICASEGDFTGQMHDNICSFHPDSPACDVDFETFHQQFVGACAEDLRTELDCALGLSFFDIRAPLTNVAIHTDRHYQPDDIGELTSSTVAQIMAAAELHQVEGNTVAEVFDNVDQEDIHYVEFWEGSNGVAYEVIEFGLGDNSFGAVFEHGRNQVVVDINDGDLVGPVVDGHFTCGPTIGPRWNDCVDNSECAAGLSCQGRADVPGHGTIGRCVDQQLGADTGRLDGDCGGTAGECPFDAGLVCSGLSHGDAGFCRSVWMSTLLRDDQILDIPDDGVLQRTVHAYGLATVPEDVVLVLDIEHEDYSQILIEMDDAGSEDFVTVFDGSDPADLASLPATSGFFTLTRNVPNSGDDEVNGAWTLRVTDREAGGDGAVLEWSLRLTSRFD